MSKETAIKLVGQKQVRSIWNDDDEKWYFLIVDVIEVLTETDRPRKYWSDLFRLIQSIPLPPNG